MDAYLFIRGESSQRHSTYQFIETGKTDRKNRTFSLHAEMIAYYRTPKSMRHAITLIVIRIDKNEDLQLSKPCKNCVRGLVNKPIRIYYT